MRQLVISWPGGGGTRDAETARARAASADTYDLVVSTRLETARLVIRTFEARDAGPWLAMVGDPEVRRFLPAGPAPTMELARRITAWKA
jgi:RimJ/RimL family protein N-acetyltransferase